MNEIICALRKSKENSDAILDRIADKISDGRFVATEDQYDIVEDVIQFVLNRYSLPVPIIVVESDKIKAYGEVNSSNNVISINSGLFQHDPDVNKFAMLVTCALHEAFHILTNYDNSHRNWRHPKTSYYRKNDYPISEELKRCLYVSSADERESRLAAQEYFKEIIRRVMVFRIKKNGFGPKIFNDSNLEKSQIFFTIFGRQSEQFFSMLHFIANDNIEETNLAKSDSVIESAQDYLKDKAINFQNNYFRKSSLTSPSDGFIFSLCHNIDHDVVSKLVKNLQQNVRLVAEQKCELAYWGKRCQASRDFYLNRIKPRLDDDYFMENFSKSVVVRSLCRNKDFMMIARNFFSSPSKIFRDMIPSNADRLDSFIEATVPSFIELLGPQRVFKPLAEKFNTKTVFDKMDQLLHSKEGLGIFSLDGDDIVLKIKNECIKNNEKIM